MKPHLIVNPASGNGRTGREFDRIARAVRCAIGEFECSFTRGRGDAKALAREVARGGARLVVGVGGDGTASEMIDGLLEGGGSSPDLELGFIPRGTGADLARTLGWPREPEEAARVLAGGARRVVDVGRVEFTAPDGSSAVRIFANVASAGLTGRVVQIVGGKGKTLGGKLTYQIGAARALLGWRDRRVRWRIDGAPWREEAVTALCVCNGAFFGGAMRVAPAAEIDDGLLDVTLWRGFGIVDFIWRRGQLYDGSHVRLPNTQTGRGRMVEVEPCDDGGGPLLLEVDGEQPGRLPARFEVLPRRLAVRARAPAPVHGL